MANKPISQLTSASEINGSTMMLVTCVDTSTTPSTYQSYKTTFDDLATLILKDIGYATELDTVNKSIFGAINEIYAGGGGGATGIHSYFGSTDPAQASVSGMTTGDLYFKYDGANQNAILAMYVYFVNAWKLVYSTT